MGLIDHDKNYLTGNSLTLDDMVITWDDEEELQLGTEAPESNETAVDGLRDAGNEQIAGKKPGPRA